MLAFRPRRTEKKVVAGAAGGGAGAVFSAFGLWLLGVTVWGAPMTAAAATEAIASVPAPVAGMMYVIGAAVGAFVGGQRAEHTPRPDIPN